MKLCRMTRNNFILIFALLVTQTYSAVAQGTSEPPLTTAPDDVLDLTAARKYMLKLINHDRATVWAPPVVLNETANAAGQEHSDEMAVNGYVGHWGLDGRKPDQRYTEAGGRDADSENTIGDLDGPKLPLASSPTFPMARLDEFEGDFFGEKPPNDAHRVNIVDPLHEYVGIGLSVAGQGENARISCVQEFIDHYGDYSEIPHAIKRGEKFTLAGKLVKGTHLQAIDIRWEEFPKPMTADDINKTYSYGEPDDITVAYFPGDDQHQITVKSVDGCEEFSADLSTQNNWKPGLYYILVWAYVNGAKEPQNISTRTFLLEAGR